MKIRSYNTYSSSDLFYLTKYLCSIFKSRCLESNRGNLFAMCGFEKQNHNSLFSRIHSRNISEWLGIRPGYSH